jgi:Protein of unknown function (DUF3638)/Protein of unknown function (DUF3645)
LLSLKVDGDFSVRPIQASVALEMISPSSGKNTVLQLNMGEGKSSVIVPMVAAVLANGHMLTRVVVLKSLSTQMFQLLVQRLSGLANRRIFYMPFSRAIKLGDLQVKLIQDLYKKCLDVGGILVVQPEHILSFKLMGIDRLVCSKSPNDREIGLDLLESQRWLEKNSRDILDESDEILHVRYQLLYAVGQHRSVEDSPHRWTTVQQVLSLAQNRVPEVRDEFPSGIVFEKRRDGGFPTIRILQGIAGAALVGLIASDILDGALFEFRPCHAYARQVILRVITEINITRADADFAKKYCEDQWPLKGLLLLRGLLAHGILLYALKERRWRVDYGLNPSRTMLAVPFRAKDVPALRAEFGHPEVATVLTCLSYYYGGLSKYQLDLCFQLLPKIENPDEEYGNWVRGAHSIPKELCQFSGVNPNNDRQYENDLVRLFRYNKAVVDFFLSRIVFLQQAKEFPERLTTSGWDIAETRDHVTTGFSGTNDNQYLLPTSITQSDPLEQLSTNAKVLSYLLQPENDRYVAVKGVENRPLTEIFVDCVVQRDPKIRILLDVGAQMLEYQNLELVRYWLQLKPDVLAAIFFGTNDEPMVLTRDNTVEEFISSPFNQQLDKCLVYLDDAHTRGTDLKLPGDSRAAVILGPKVTKDRLLQGQFITFTPLFIQLTSTLGCMRMRRLGQGQSVMFFAPVEVDQAIREVAAKVTSDRVQVADILRWSMLETCTDIQHHCAHWAQQGMDYENRKNAWLKWSSDTSSIDKLKSSWLRPDARSLDTLYPILSKVRRRTGEPPLRHASFEITELRERCQRLGVSHFANIALEEEQEREVTHEVEKERHVERPPQAKAANHRTADHLPKFIQGIIPLSTTDFVRISFTSHQNTTASLDHWWSQDLLTTQDFLTTIQNQSQNVGDYLRPVNWILSRAIGGRIILVVLSPHEVNDMLPEIRKSKAVHLHQYSPQVIQTTGSFDNLDFYCIPPLKKPWAVPPLVTQLGLWAGQLYWPDYNSYRQVCNLLGISTDEDGDGSSSSHRNNFRSLEYQPGTLHPFNRHLLPSLIELVGRRRRGMDYSLSHLGRILHGRMLRMDDFQRQIYKQTETETEI